MDRNTYPSRWFPARVATSHLRIRRDPATQGVVVEFAGSANLSGLGIGVVDESIPVAPWVDSPEMARAVWNPGDGLPQLHIDAPTSTWEALGVEVEA